MLLSLRKPAQHWAQGRRRRQERGRRRRGEEGGKRETLDIHYLTENPVNVTAQGRPTSISGLRTNRMWMRNCWPLDPSSSSIWKVTPTSHPCLGPQGPSILPTSALDRNTFLLVTPVLQWGTVGTWEPRRTPGR